MNISFNHTKTFSAAFLILVATLFSGCISGPSSSTGTAAPAVAPAPSILVGITGTVATGSPIIGVVTISDSAIPQHRITVPIDVAGHYSVLASNMTGMTEPYALLASGQAGGKYVQLYSLGMHADRPAVTVQETPFSSVLTNRPVPFSTITSNITPFTDIIVQSVAGGSPDQLFNNTGGKLSSVTNAQLENARAIVTAILAPVIQAAGLNTDIDLLRASFNANHTGLDRIMDIVKVTQDPANAAQKIIQNIVDPSSAVTFNPASGTRSGILGSANVAAGGAAMDAILQVFNKFNGFIKAGAPPQNDMNLLALFSGTFLSQGIKNLPDTNQPFLARELTNPILAGMSTSNIVIDKLNTALGTALVDYDLLDAKGLWIGHAQWNMGKNGAGEWVFNGDQRIAQIDISAASRKEVFLSGPCLGTPPKYSTGLNLHIADVGQIGIGFAVVTGPGLPASGIMLTPQSNPVQPPPPAKPIIYEFNISPLPSPPGSPACQNKNGIFYAMTDAEIDLIKDNSIYTVALYSVSNIYTNSPPLAVYTITVPKAPYPNSQMATRDFPTINSDAFLVGYKGGNTVISWTTSAIGSGGRLNVLTKTGIVTNPSVGLDIPSHSVVTRDTKTLSLPAGPYSSAVYDISESSGASFLTEMKTIYYSE